jgi:hypothetical protein
MTALSLPVPHERPGIVDAVVTAYRRARAWVLMAVNNIRDTLRSNMCDEIGLDIDSGAGAGLLEIWTAAFALKLATLTFSDPSYAAASAGVAQENAITSDASADATGTAAVLRVTTSTPATVYEGSVGTSGQDLNFNSVAFVAGDTVAVTDYPNTVPAS